MHKHQITLFFYKKYLFIVRITSFKRKALISTVFCFVRLKWFNINNKNLLYNFHFKWKNDNNNYRAPFISRQHKFQKALYSTISAHLYLMKSTKRSWTYEKYTLVAIAVKLRLSLWWPVSGRSSSLVVTVGSKFW